MELYLINKHEFIRIWVLIEGWIDEFINFLVVWFEV